MGRNKSGECHSIYIFQSNRSHPSNGFSCRLKQQPISINLMKQMDWSLFSTLPVRPPPSVSPAGYKHHQRCFFSNIAFGSNANSANGGKKAIFHYRQINAFIVSIESDTVARKNMKLYISVCFFDVQRFLLPAYENVKNIRADIELRLYGQQLRTRCISSRILINPLTLQTCQPIILITQHTWTSDIRRFVCVAFFRTTSDFKWPALVFIPNLIGK